MRVLLDTHVFLWLQTDPERLGAQLAIAEDPRTNLVLSAASAWEIAIKHALGRLPLPEPPVTYVPTRRHAIGAAALPIEHGHALAVAELPPVHRDPFDRMLVAQSRLENLVLLTADPVFTRYDVDALAID